MSYNNQWEILTALDHPYIDLFTLLGMESTTSSSAIIRTTKYHLRIKDFQG